MKLFLREYCLPCQIPTKIHNFDKFSLKYKGTLLSSVVNDLNIAKVVSLNLFPSRVPMFPLGNEPETSCGWLLRLRGVLN